MEKQAQFTNKKILFKKNVDFPELPGVYKFFNSEHEIIYIGKAKNIKNRVKSYLNVRQGEGKRIAKLKSSIKFVEIIITETESDALILEQGLISKKRPPVELRTLNQATKRAKKTPKPAKGVWGIIKSMLPRINKE